MKKTLSVAVAILLAAHAVAARPPMPEVGVRTLSRDATSAVVSVTARYPGAVHVSMLDVAPVIASVSGRVWRVALAPLTVSVSGCSGQTCYMPVPVHFDWNGQAFVESAAVSTSDSVSASSSPGLPQAAGGKPHALPPAAPPRVLEGYQPAGNLIAFLEDRAPDAAGSLADHSLAVIILLVLLGGLALNFTPCVLPMIPVNLAIIGAGTKAGSRAAGAVRGGAYGLGIALAYGSLGLLAALGGTAFGTIQSNPWFNAAIAVIFVVLALSLLDLFFIDFQRFATAGGGRKGSLAAAFIAGAVSAILAGACVAPILIAVLLLTADGVAKGAYLSLALPFLLGLGMALPWPFVGAGLSLLPKPGAWMNYVKKAFAVVVFGFAAYYGHLAYVGFRHAAPSAASREPQAAVTPATWPDAFAAARATGKPVFVDVFASWCKNCSAMEETTFRDEAVKAALERFAVIRLQAESLGELKGLPGFESVKVNGIPLLLVYPVVAK